MDHHEHVYETVEEVSWPHASDEGFKTGLKTILLRPWFWPRILISFLWS